MTAAVDNDRFASHVRRVQEIPPRLNHVFGRTVTSQGGRFRQVRCRRCIEVVRQQNRARRDAVHADPRSQHARVFELFTGSWIDEMGSRPGVDLGTWIGEPEENRAWELLGRARAEITRRSARPETAPDAFAALYAAQGSDWFWWFGADQESAGDALFDDLFRAHLRSIFRSLGAATPAWLDEHIMPRTVKWTFARPTATMHAGDRLTVQTNCPGVLTWQLRDEAPQSTSLAPTGGVMAGTRRHQTTIGPFDDRAGPVRFRFRCTAPGCDGRDICCRQDEQIVRIELDASARDAHR